MRCWPCKFCGWYGKYLSSASRLRLYCFIRIDIYSLEACVCVCVFLLLAAGNRKTERLADKFYDNFWYREFYNPWVVISEGLTQICKNTLQGEVRCILRKNSFLSSLAVSQKAQQGGRDRPEEKAMQFMIWDTCVPYGTPNMSFDILFEAGYCQEI